MFFSHFHISIVGETRKGTVKPHFREYLRGYRTGKKRNNASECERSRPRGTSFNDGKNDVLKRLKVM